MRSGGNTKLRWSGLLLLWLWAGAAVATVPLHGRYLGVLRHPALHRDQLAKLDLIAGTDENDQPQLIGILTLSFGDYASHEYVSYHYEKVSFDADKGSLVFDQADQPVTIVTRRFDGERLEGEVMSVWGDHPAELLLQSEDLGPVKPALPLIEPVWGEYEGSCHEGKERIQLNTFRFYEDTTKVGHSFASYQIVGQTGIEDRNGFLCGGPGQPLCTHNLVESGAYNFFTGDLNLMFHREQMHCPVLPDGIRCGGCTFKRISRETEGPRHLSPPLSKAAFPSPAVPFPPPKEGSVPLRSGYYRGYLHHELLDEYQAGSLKLMVYPESGKPGIFHVSSMGKLAFGPVEGNEFLPYRFTDRAYSTGRPATLLLKNREADTDAIVQVTRIAEHSLRGIWYSRLYGRVGTFEFRDDAMPKLPAGAKLMGTVSGKYESTDWDLDFEVRQGKTPFNTDNPFFPNMLLGHIRQKQVGKRDAIKAGSYDFYTGRIGFELESGRTFSGDRYPGDRYFLSPTTVQFGTPMSPHWYYPFRRTPVPHLERR